MGFQPGPRKLPNFLTFMGTGREASSCLSLSSYFPGTCLHSTFEHGTLGTKSGGRTPRKRNERAVGGQHIWRVSRSPKASDQATPHPCREKSEEMRALQMEGLDRPYGRTLGISDASRHPEDCKKLVQAEKKLGGSQPRIWGKSRQGEAWHGSGQLRAGGEGALWG